MSKEYKTFDYAAKTEELEGVLAQLQSEDIRLDEALRLHEAGTKLLAEIGDYLRYAENEVKEHLAKD
ncbi:exodeoxyribonuclease VII small subunit [Candidatus Saccharibacteria bacterium]|nr:exodeoxyribonuclease VII small subunit [Candidatus Saccharibacteria bacterium]